jgi:membrane-bound serine protease (ClpP class)
MRTSGRARLALGPAARRRAVALVLCLLAAIAPASAQDPAGRPPIITAEYDGIIHPIAAEYVGGVIDAANSAGAQLEVVTLRTPGGLLDATQEMVSKIIASRAPVVMFVGPSSARAASAGFIRMMAADVAVMAPGTHIGAAHPVPGDGTPVDDTMSKKMAADAAAYVRSLAGKRGRNVMLAELAVTESRAFTDSEALMASPPLIDFVAPDVAGILQRLDGRAIARFDGSMTTVHTAGAEVREIAMTRRQRFLGGIAHPQIAFLLLTLGTLGLTIELWSPGAILPGVAGGLCLLLAFFALQILPVSATGLLLIVFGVSLLILEVKIPSFGALGVGGAVSLFLGSLLMTRQVPGVEVSLTLIVPVVVAVAALGVLLGRLALRAQRQRSVTGAEGMIGREAVARTPLSAQAPGQVDVHGEIWRAVSATPVDINERVRILEVTGLTLRVEPTGASRHGDSG